MSPTPARARCARSTGWGGPTSRSPRSGVRSGPFIKALRPHQWAKNALLLAPVLTGHVAWTAGLVLHLLLGFFAFSLAASSIYLVNDLADLPHDRRHPRKRRRPLAAGTLPVTHALAAVPVLLAVALGAAAFLPPAFAPTLAGYVTLSVAYSFWLKRRLLVDVMTLATLYAVRVIAGAEVANLVISRWFAAFAIFVFFALATVKRVVELRDLAARTAGDDADPAAAADASTVRIAGRAYMPVDQQALLSLGTAATAASAVVYCLYVASPSVEQLYRRPDLLWPGMPLLLYWQARVWVFAMRGALHDDPIAFALRDRVSWLVAAALAACVLLAA